MCIVHAAASNVLLMAFAACSTGLGMLVTCSWAPVPEGRGQLVVWWLQAADMARSQQRRWQAAHQPAHAK